MKIKMGLLLNALLVSIFISNLLSVSPYFSCYKFLPEHHWVSWNFLFINGGGWGVYGEYDNKKATGNIMIDSSPIPAGHQYYSYVAFLDVDCVQNIKMDLFRGR